MKLNLFKNLLAFSVPLVLASCVTPVKPLYYWGNYSSVSYQAVKNNEAEDVQKLRKSYEDIIKNQNKGSRGVPPPGICADYGFLLINAGEIENGKKMLEREIELYPESKIFIDRIIKMTQPSK